MQCPKCQFESPDGSKFCLGCGKKFELRCPKCDNPLPVSAKFCNECGYNLTKPAGAHTIDYSEPQSYTPKHLTEKILNTRSSIEGERKLVTVLFADVANYTSISEKLDPEEVHQIMDGCFKILMDEIHRYEGTINQFTGDGVMALFGAPVAHEDHALRGCYAALAIQKALISFKDKISKERGVDFKMRIGLNSGPVIVGSIGDDLRMDYTAVGDTTNLAARIESVAKPGNILLAKNTYRLVRDFFQIEPMGKIEVKGKEELQETFGLIKAKAIETRIEAATARGLTKFVGRNKEIEALIDALEKARSGSGQVVGVVGEAGVGKSRLLLELKNTLSDSEYTYLEGRCLHYGSSIAYLPILDILRTYFEINEGDRESIIKNKMKEKILRFGDKFNSVIFPFQEILSVKIDNRAYLKTDPGEKKMRTFEAIRDLLFRESQIKTIVLAIEDLHWVDKTSEEFLDYLIGWIANAPIMLILLYRPEYSHQWGSKSYYSKIGVDQLSQNTSTELVQAILEDGEIVPEVSELVFKRAGGNPLFVEELTQSLIESGSIEKKNHQYFLIRKASEIRIPDTIQGIIAARIDRVEENLKRVIQVASVIGREFAFLVLQKIMGMKEEPKSALLNLQSLEFITEKRLFPELEYIFKHALTQEVAYNSILLKRRKEIHENVGRAIEDLYSGKLEEYYDLLSYHYSRSDNKAKALEYLSLANQKAINISAMIEAKSYFNEAMALLDDLPETAKNQQRRMFLLVSQWPVFFLLLEFPEYYDLLNRLESIATNLGNQELLGMFYARKAQCEWWFAEFDHAIQNGTKAIELCERVGNTEGIDSACMAIQWSYHYKGEYEKAIAMKKYILQRGEQELNIRQYVYVFCGISFANAELGRWSEAIEMAQEALRIAEESSNKSLISFAAWMLSHAYNFKGELEKARKYSELAVQKASTPGDKAFAQFFLAWALCRSGESNRGIDILSALVSMCGAVRYVSGEVWGMSHLGEGYWLAGEYNKAIQTLEKCIERADHLGMKFYSGFAHRILGEIAIKTKNEKSAAHFQKSIALLQEIKAENELALAYTGYGRLHKQKGHITQAREYLTKALKIFDRLETLIEPEKAREILAELPEV